MPERVGGNKAKRLLLPDVSPRLISSKWFTYFVMRPVSTLELRSLTALHITYWCWCTWQTYHFRTAYGTFEWVTVCYESPSSGAPSIRRSGSEGRRRPPEIDQLSNVHMTKSHPTTKYQGKGKLSEQNLIHWIRGKIAGKHLLYYQMLKGFMLP